MRDNILEAQSEGKKYEPFPIVPKLPVLFLLSRWIVATHLSCAKISGKRKRVFATMEKRPSSLKRIDNGESAMNIFSKLNVGKSTVNN